LVAALAGRVGGAVDALDEGPPAGVVEPQRGVLPAAPRIGDAVRAAGVAQHGPRAGRARGSEQLERMAQAREALLPVLALGEAHRDVAADDLELVRVQALREHRALAVVARRAEIGAGVPRAGDRGEHLLGVGHWERGADGHLEGAVAE